jgi:selenocysteine lyase/cysteine desulfurase
VAEPSAPDDDKVAALRAALPAVNAGIYLDVAAAGPLPAETAAALRESDEWELRVGRGGLDREDELEQREAEAKAVLASVVPGAGIEQITLAAGVADALRRIAAGGAEPTATELVDPVTGASAVHPTLGHVLDASGLMGAMALPAEVLDADHLVFATDRWLLGPEGTAAIWTHAGASEPDGTDRLSRRALLGMARSLGWIQMYVGLPWMQERTARLARVLHQALRALDGVDVLTPPESLAAIVTFRIAGWQAADAADELSHRAHAIVSIVQPEGAAKAIRASVGAWNTLEELQSFAEGVGLLAAYSPQSLPRRPSLVVLPG